MELAERQTYLLYSKLNSFDVSIKSAKTIIKRGLSKMSSPYISLSFGKDSIVMVHLLLSEFGQFPVMYVNCGEWDEWPDTPRVKREFLAQITINEFIKLLSTSIMGAYQRGGFYIQDEETSRDAKRAQHDYSASLGITLDNEAKQRGYDGAFIGVRKEESDNRRRLFAMRGAVYYAKTRKLWACHPLAYWSGQDIWAYIVKYNLPYNELYDLAPEGRELARNGAMIGTRSARYGRLVFLRKMYPDWFNRFAAEFPEVRCYV